MYFELMNRDGSLIVVETNKQITQTVKHIHDNSKLDIVSHTRLDKNDIEEEDIDFKITL